MTFLPIVERELRVAARRRSTWRFRLSAAFLGLTVLAWILLIPDFVSPQRMGKTLFGGLVMTSFAYALLIGIFTTADSVSEEKREGTLGLLFLTDLNGYDIVLGKLAATSINAIYGLMAIFPVMAIPLLAGGVSGAEFTRVILVLSNTMFFSLAIGIFVSATVRDERAAVALTFGLLLFFSAGMPLIGMLEAEARRGQMDPFFYVMSPPFTCVAALENVSRGGTSGLRLFGWSLGVIHVLAWLFLGMACYAMPRSWQDKTSGSAMARMFEKWQQVRFGLPEARLAFRRYMLSHNPFAWLAARDQIKSLFLWIFLGVTALLWFWGYAVYKRQWLDVSMCLVTGFTVQTIMKLWLISEACRQFGQDRKSGALELILSTPLSVRHIVEGQLIALRRQFAGPVMVVLAIEFLFMMSTRHEDGTRLAFLAGMSIFVADLIAGSWVGMWMAVNSRNLQRASSATMVRILALPWMIYGVMMTLLAISSTMPEWRWITKGLEGPKEERFFIGSWFVISVVVAVGFGVHARQKLLSCFRQAAMRRLGSRPLLVSEKAEKTDRP